MKTAVASFGRKVYTECDLFAAAGVGFLIGSLYASTIMLLLHKLTGAL